MGMSPKFLRQSSPSHISKNSKATSPKPFINHDRALAGDVRMQLSYYTGYGLATRSQLSKVFYRTPESASAASLNGRSRSIDFSQYMSFMNNFSLYTASTIPYRRRSSGLSQRHNWLWQRQCPKTLWQSNMTSCETSEEFQVRRYTETLTLFIAH